MPCQQLPPRQAYLINIDRLHRLGAIHQYRHAVVLDKCKTTEKRIWRPVALVEALEKHNTDVNGGNQRSVEGKNANKTSAGGKNNLLGNVIEELALGSQHFHHDVPAFILQQFVQVRLVTPTTAIAGIRA